MGPDAMIFVFWMLNLSPLFHSPLFTLIKRLFSSSSLSAIRVVSSVYLRLLIFLLAILVPTYDSSSLAFHVMYPACKLTKQVPRCTPYSVVNRSVVPCPVLTVASWPAYRFLKKQVRWSGQNFTEFLVIHTVKGFGMVNKAEIDVSLEFFCFFLMIQWMLAIWSRVPLPFLTSLALT